MRLHVHEWGDAAAPPLVCVHGVSAHGRRFIFQMTIHTLGQTKSVRFSAAAQ